MEDLLKKQITITEAINDGTKVKVTDHDGVKYTFFVKKQDGSDSMAYSFWKTLDANGKGTSVIISYKETQGEFKGNPVTYRNIMTMTYGMKQSVVQTVAHVKTQEVKKVDEQEKWDRLGWGKCKTLFLVEAFKLDMASLETFEPIAEQWADACMRKLEKKQEVEQVPTINLDEFGDLENRVDQIIF